MGTAVGIPVLSALRSCTSADVPVRDGLYSRHSCFFTVTDRSDTDSIVLCYDRHHGYLCIEQQRGTCRRSGRQFLPLNILCSYQSLTLALTPTNGEPSGKGGVCGDRGNALAELKLAPTVSMRAKTHPSHAGGLLRVSGRKESECDGLYGILEYEVCRPVRMCFICSELGSALNRPHLASRTTVL